MITTSVADITADNTNGNKTLLARGVSILFINGKPTVIDGLTKHQNPPSWLVILLVVPLNKVLLFSNDLITFVIPFISLFLRHFHGPLLDLNFLLISFIALLISYSVAF